ncbi:MAG: 30S ribosome-binding factor RbfA [Gammaproteobacteria bacterium]|nr:30S ribosome-binding factor RbfA [Gammaproteobacteria bacterium]
MSTADSWEFGGERVARKARVGPQIAQVLAGLLARFADPRLALVTVTAVDVSPDLKQARVWVSSVNPDADADKTLAALRHAGTRLRRELASRVHLRTVPRLSFVWDHGSEDRERLDELISRGLPSSKGASTG